MKTLVAGNFKEVFQRFDRDLFEALKPVGMKLDIVEFTGSKVGDKVHLRFGFPVNTDWVSEITEEHIGDEECYFVDVGTKLPWPLTSWRHKHIVAHAAEDAAYIIDEISFEAGGSVMSMLVKPFMQLSFRPRMSQYSRYFGVPSEGGQQHLRK